MPFQARCVVVRQGYFSKGYFSSPFLARSAERERGTCGGKMANASPWNGFSLNGVTVRTKYSLSNFLAFFVALVAS